MQRKRVIGEMICAKQGRGGHTSHFRYTQGRNISSSFCVSHDPCHGQGKELCCVLRVYLDPEITSYCCITTAASSKKNEQRHHALTRRPHVTLQHSVGRLTTTPAAQLPKCLDFSNHDISLPSCNPGPSSITHHTSSGSSSSDDTATTVSFHESDTAEDPEDTWMALELTAIDTPVQPRRRRLNTPSQMPCDSDRLSIPSGCHTPVTDSD